jgi:hypothetical protein
MQACKSSWRDYGQTHFIARLSNPGQSSCNSKSNVGSTVVLGLGSTTGGAMAICRSRCSGRICIASTMTSRPSSRTFELAARTLWKMPAWLPGISPSGLISFLISSDRDDLDSLLPTRSTSPLRRAQPSKSSSDRSAASSSQARRPRSDHGGFRNSPRSWRVDLV